MQSFWRFLLRADLPSDLLDGLRIGVFGLGDSSYPKYNWVAKKLYRRLVEGLGATPLLEKGEGDEQDYLGIDTALMPWSEALFTALDALRPLPSGVEVVPADRRPASRLVLQPALASSAKGKGREEALPIGMRWATLRRNERVTAADHFQDTRAIELEFDEPAACVCRHVTPLTSQLRAWRHR